MSKRRYISEKIRKQIYNKYNGHCAYCGCMIQYDEMQVDHFAPVHFFGDNIKDDNLMPACQACNKYKSSKTITVFRKTLKEALTKPKSTTDFVIRVKYRDQQDLDNIKFYFENTDDTVESKNS